MTRLFSIATIATLTACGVPAYEQATAMKITMDLTKESIIATNCTRGNLPFRLTVGKDGEAFSKIIQTDAEVKAKVPPTTFPARFRTIGKDTVQLEIPVGPATNEPISETLKPVISGGEIVLRGDSFDCTNTRVRKYR